MHGSFLSYFCHLPNILFIMYFFILPFRLQQVAAYVIIHSLTPLYIHHLPVAAALHTCCKLRQLE